MTMNNTDYKDVTIDNDGGWICKPVLLAKNCMIRMITPVTTWNLIRPERLSRCIVQDH